MKIEVSNGEIVDKYTILQIKLKNCPQSTLKYSNILNEYNLIQQDIEKLNIDKNLIAELYTINQQLWDIEDSIRSLEEKKQFDQDFIHLARSVYITNDKRFELKSIINKQSNSTVKEEKILPIYNL